LKSFPGRSFRKNCTSVAEAASLDFFILQVRTILITSETKHKVFGPDAQPRSATTNVLGLAEIDVYTSSMALRSTGLVSKMAFSCIYRYIHS
jgi:hypothetical protein